MLIASVVELSLSELGFHNVFAHVGVATQIRLRGKECYPLVTGTFGGVDFLHSVLGEATVCPLKYSDISRRLIIGQDHVTQTEIDDMQKSLAAAAAANGGGQDRALAIGLTSLLAKVPGTGSFIQEAEQLQSASNSQAAANMRTTGFPNQSNFDSTSRDVTDAASFKQSSRANVAYANMDVQATVAKIYPILEFRDKVVKGISRTVATIPGLESLIETITEKVTMFVMGLLAPYIQPIITAASGQLKTGSSAVVNSSAKHQYEVWEKPYSTDPTHSMLSKDHFSNILNEPAGQVASTVLQYVAPRIVYAWEHAGVPVGEVLDDIVRVFHHPVLRDQNCEIQMKMFAAVEHWTQSLSDRGQQLNTLLGSESVRLGGNHKGGDSHAHGAASGNPNVLGLGSHSKVTGSPFALFQGQRDAQAGEGQYGPQLDQGYAAQQGVAMQTNTRLGNSSAFPTAYGHGGDEGFQQHGYEQQQQHFYPNQQGNYYNQ